MSFKVEALQSRLAATNETTDSITSTAQWILFHKRQADTIAREWAQFLDTQTNKLSTIYLANEVIQQSKMKRKGEFVDAFAPILPAALAAAYSVSNLATRDRIVRVIKVWRERGIFSPEDQQKIEQAINKGPEVPAELQLLVRHFVELKGNPSQDVFQAVESELKNVASAAARIMSARESAPQAPHSVRYTAQDAVSGGNVDTLVQNDDSDEDIGYAPDDSEIQDAKRQKI